MFSTEFKSMIYVQDVEAEKNFWHRLGFTIVNEQHILGFPTFDMKINPESNCTFTVYSLDFINKYSPDMTRNQPNLLFFTPYIESLYEQAKLASAYVSELNLTPYKNFTFEAPSGQYYTVREE